MSSAHPSRRRLAKRGSNGRLIFAIISLGLVGVVVWQLTALAVTGISQMFDAAAPITKVTGIELHQTYTVSVGDTLIGIAHRFGISESALSRANHLRNPNNITVGERLIIPNSFHPARTRRLIRWIAAKYHLDPAFAVGLADEESGWDENAVSATGAIGVMQIEPQTGVFLAQRLGRNINLGVEKDNVTAGVYWLSYLVRYYGGNERSAAAAYYEGQGNLARHGYVGGAGQYVANVMALRQRYFGVR
jgi:soluble lytic murein transglycosylase-like protein